jgi:hypothetical protein
VDDLPGRRKWNVFRLFAGTVGGNLGDGARDGDPAGSLEGELSSFGVRRLRGVRGDFSGAETAFLSSDVTNSPIA